MTTVWVLGFVSYYSIFGTLVPVHHIKNHIHVQQLTVIQQSPTHITWKKLLVYKEVTISLHFTLFPISFLVFYSLFTIYYLLFIYYSYIT